MERERDYQPLLSPEHVFAEALANEVEIVPIREQEDLGPAQQQAIEDFWDNR